MSTWIDRVGNVYILSSGITVAVVDTTNGREWRSIVIASSHAHIRTGDTAFIDFSDNRCGTARKFEPPSDRPDAAHPGPGFIPRGR